MLSQNFDIPAAVLALSGALIYAWTTFRGKARPDRITWLLWFISPSVMFAAEIAQHVHLEVTLLTLSEAVGPFLVLVASLMNAKSYWKIGVFDWCCGALSALAIILWLITGKGDVALIFSLIASFSAAIPTIIKSYSYPRTESPWDYLASILAGVITLLTIRNWTLANYGFPVYIIIECSIIGFLVLTPRRAHETEPSSQEPVKKTGQNLEPEPGLAVTKTSPEKITDTPAKVRPPVAIVPPMALKESGTATTGGSKPAGGSLANTQDIPDNAPPVLDNPSWSRNPVAQGAKTILRVPTEHGASIVQAEYHGSVDPGKGKGFAMSIEKDALTATFVANVPKGPYPIFIRFKNSTGIWSEPLFTMILVD